MLLCYPPSSSREPSPPLFVADFVIFIRPDPFFSLLTFQALPPRKYIPVGLLLDVAFCSSRIVILSLNSRWRAVVDSDGIVEIWHRRQVAEYSKAQGDPSRHALLRVLDGRLQDFFGFRLLHLDLRHRLFFGPSG